MADRLKGLRQVQCNDDRTFRGFHLIEALGDLGDERQQSRRRRPTRAETVLRITERKSFVEERED